MKPVDVIRSTNYAYQRGAELRLFFFAGTEMHDIVQDPAQDPTGRQQQRRPAAAEGQQEVRRRPSWR